MGVPQKLFLLLNRLIRRINILIVPHPDSRCFEVIKYIQGFFCSSCSFLISNISIFKSFYRMLNTDVNGIN